MTSPATSIESRRPGGFRHRAFTSRGGKKVVWERDGQWWGPLGRVSHNTGGSEVPFRQIDDDFTLKFVPVLLR